MPLIDTKHTEASGPDGPTAGASDERANRYDILSRLADDLAHEIKNPLNAMVVNLELVRRWLQNGKTAAAVERIDFVEHEVRRVHALVEQLLQLLRPARTQTGPIAVDALIDALAGAVQLQAKAARVPLEFKTETSLYAEIRAEPFNFALLNLVTYAIDAEAEAGGAVVLTAGRAASDIYLELKCTRADLSRAHEHVHFAGLLVRAAGGALESVEPQPGGSGTIVTLVLPPGRFAATKPTGNNFE